MPSWVKDVARNLPTLVPPSDYNPLLMFQVGRDEGVTRSQRTIQRPFMALGQLVKEPGAQVLFSVLPVEENDEGRNRKS